MTNREYLERISNKNFAIVVNCEFFDKSLLECENWLGKECERDLETFEPCPFCGETDCVGVFREDEITEELKEVSSAPWGWAVCCDAQHGGCGATSGYKPNKERAVAAWNWRA